MPVFKEFLMKTIFCSLVLLIAVSSVSAQSSSRSDGAGGLRHSDGSSSRSDGAGGFRHSDGSSSRSDGAGGFRHSK